jgi:hypothetical protein
MVKFRLLRRARARGQIKGYHCGNHEQPVEGASCTRGVLTHKILIEFDTVKFEENSHRIHVDFAQKPHFNANNSFKPVCYGLVQRRRNNRRE